MLSLTSLFSMPEMYVVTIDIRCEVVMFEISTAVNVIVGCAVSKGAAYCGLALFSISCAS